MQSRDGVNEHTITPLTICTNDLSSVNLTRFELLENPEWLKQKIVYPPRAEFIDFYNIMIEHMKRVWTCVETNLSSDIAKFKFAPKSLTSLVKNVIGLFILGDTVVLDKLNKLQLTPNVIRMFLDNQTDRENTHQLTYSMWADILEDSNYVRSQEFVDTMLSPFASVAKKYENYDDNRIILFFIMVCEMIFFVPGFQVLCYLATTGYAPNLCNANMLVMRDEHMHYMFARTALSKYTQKLNKPLALNILNDMVSAVSLFIQSITREAQHDVLSESNMLQHLHYVVHKFKVENCLYDDENDLTIEDGKYGHTPAWDYMHLLKYETKINYMESLSTNYKIPGPMTDDSVIDLSFD